MKKFFAQTSNRVLAAVLVVLLAAGVVFVVLGLTAGGAPAVAPQAENSMRADASATVSGEKDESQRSGASDASGTASTSEQDTSSSATAGDGSAGADSSSNASESSPSSSHSSDTTGNATPATPSEPQQLTVTLSIDASTMGRGSLMVPRTVTFAEGETVFDVLYRECRASGIPMASRFTPLYNSAYIEGIDNLYEFDGGELSGWMYNVNGWYPNYGCSSYVLSSGDVIQWRYTCDLGRDIGASGAVQG